MSQAQTRRRRPTPPEHSASAPQWQAYIGQAEDLAERRARLAQAPETMRQRLESHLQTLFAVRANQQRIREERARRRAAELSRGHA